MKKVIRITGIFFTIFKLSAGAVSPDIDSYLSDNIVASVKDISISKLLDFRKISAAINDEFDKARFHYIIAFEIDRRLNTLDDKFNAHDTKYRETIGRYEDELDITRQTEVLIDTASGSNEVTDRSSNESTPAVFVIPSLSAESLTNKGSHLFTEGRFQEAVDQFTKAITLDPRYHVAWAKRAETYVRMGLTQKAEEDLRNLEGI